MQPTPATTTERGLSQARRAGEHVQRCLVFYIALLSCAFTIAAYYPGYMSPDSVVQLQQARTGVTTNVYPPLMDEIWSVTDKILPGPAGMLILHNIVFWFALAVLAHIALARAVWRVLFVLLAGFWPPTFGSLGTIWKDVGMQVFLVAALAAVFYAHSRRRVWPLAIALVCLFVAAGYRHNGIAAVVPLVVLCIMELASLAPERLPRLNSYLRQRKLLRASYVTACILALGLIWETLDFVNNYRIPDAHLWSAAVVHDLVGISVQQNARFLPDYLDPAHELSAEDLKHIYSPLHANSLFDPSCRLILGVPNPSPKAFHYVLNDTDARQLQLYWLTTVLDHLGSYLHHRLAIDAKLLVLQTEQPWYPYVTGIDPNPFGLEFHHSLLNSAVMTVIKASAFQYPLYSAWFYYAVVAGCLLISFLWDFRYARAVQILAASAYLYYVSIFMFSMSGDFRYNVWMLTCAYICPVLLAAGRDKTPPKSA
jgi:hypothetical protein